MSSSFVVINEVLDKWFKGIAKDDKSPFQKDRTVVVVVVVVVAMAGRRHHLMNRTYSKSNQMNNVPMWFFVVEVVVEYR
jgi:hypothetical protein